MHAIHSQRLGNFKVQQEGYRRPLLACAKQLPLGVGVEWYQCWEEGHRQEPLEFSPVDTCGFCNRELREIKDECESCVCLDFYD